MSIKFRVRQQYREEGTLIPPNGLTAEEIREWISEATKIEMEELFSV